MRPVVAFFVFFNGFLLSVAYIPQPPNGLTGSKVHCTLNEVTAEWSCGRGFHQCIPPGKLIRRTCKEGYLFDQSKNRCSLLSQMSGCPRNQFSGAETRYMVEPNRAPVMPVNTAFNPMGQWLPQRPRVTYPQPVFDAYAVSRFAVGGDPFVHDAPAPAALVQHSFNTPGPSVWQFDYFKSFEPPKAVVYPSRAPLGPVPKVRDAFDVSYASVRP